MLNRRDFLIAAAGSLSACGVTSMAAPRVQTSDPVWDVPPRALADFAAGLREVGVTTLRMPIRWRVVEPRRAEWNFDRVEAVLTALPPEIAIVGLLTSPPPWSKADGRVTAEGWFDAYVLTDHDARWMSYVARVTRRLSGWITRWEHNDLPVAGYGW